MADVVGIIPRSRVSRACETCRALKCRCIYKSDQGICQRCTETGTQCVVRTKARPMRTRAVRLQASETVDTLQTDHSPVSSDPKFFLDLPTLPSPDTKGQLEELEDHHKQFFGNDESDCPAHEGASHSKESPKRIQQSSVLIKQRKITLEQAEDLLASFKLKAHYLPFIQVSHDATVPSLSRTSPFLLLAILCTAALGDSTLYHQLDYEFRRVMSLKVIVEGQKSLDCLQGLLVYIAWYPIHTSPKNNQIFIYMNIAITLISDMGLDYDTPNTTSFGEFDARGLIESGVFTDAAKRTYLGCYFMASILSLGFQKPKDLKYRNLMNEHGEQFLKEQNSNEIHALVKLQQLGERIALLHSSGDGEAIHSQSLTAEMSAQAFTNELDEWKATVPDEIQNRVAVGMMERFVSVSIYSHRLGFLRRPYRNLVRESTQRFGNEAQLYKCLAACKRYFEYLLSLPEISFAQFSTVQWVQYVQTILVLSRLTFLMASDLNWDAETTRTNIPMVMYLDCLCFRFERLSKSKTTATGAPPANPDAIYVMKMIVESLKKSYVRRVASIKPSSLNMELGISGNMLGHCPMMDPSLNLYFNDSLSSSENSASYSQPTPPVPSTTVPFHDIWATMTGSWAQE